VSLQRHPGGDALGDAGGHRRSRQQPPHLARGETLRVLVHRPQLRDELAAERKAPRQRPERAEHSRLVEDVVGESLRALLDGQRLQHRRDLPRVPPLAAAVVQRQLATDDSERHRGAPRARLDEPH
jgi:hypothetical protein